MPDKSQFQPKRTGFPFCKLPTKVRLLRGWWCIGLAKKQTIDMIIQTKKLN